MVKLKINNIECEASDGATILNVAKKSGFPITTLCFKEGLPHYSSCMVCLVKDNRTNTFVPSCSALVQEGMDIDTKGEDVLFLRKKAVEMLLSEHRAECDAPCRVVCPAGYNIPLMNRLLAAKEFEAAINLSSSGTNDDELFCVNCPGYCENACRRKKVDLPVSIRNLQLFIYYRTNTHKQVQPATDQTSNTGLVKEKVTLQKKVTKRFGSHIGKLE